MSCITPTSQQQPVRGPAIGDETVKLGDVIRNGELSTNREKKLFSALVAVALSLLMLLTAPGAQASSSAAQHFLCEGEPLEALAFNGAVDAAGIPNSNADTVPGAFVVLRWRELSLQLPRTNNAGVPSYSDGRWWWQALDPDHPDFAQLRGNVERYSCERLQ